MKVRSIFAAIRGLLRWYFRVGVGLAFVGLSSGVSQAEEVSPQKWFFPSAGTWERVEAIATVADEQRLQSALDFAERKNSKGVVVLWRGKILAERYWDGADEGTVHPAYSLTKSLVATLVGMAVEDGAIRSVDQPAADFLPEWKGSEAHEAITVGDLLSMTSGLEGGKRIFVRGLLARNARAFGTGLDLAHRPGTRWEYHNAAYRLLFPILEEATGEGLEAYTERKLLRPLGMDSTRWEKKQRLLHPDQHTFMTMSPRDAARYGHFVLAGGNWDGCQLVGREWIERATRPAYPGVHPSYGYLWWLNGGRFHYTPLDPAKQSGPIFPGSPDDAFAALGKDDQNLYVVPGLDLVVARFGDAADPKSAAISEFDAELLRRVVSAMPGDGGSDSTRASEVGGDRSE